MQFSIEGRDVALRCEIARRRLGLSTRAMGKRLRCSYMTVIRVEKGIHSPRLDYLQALADASGLELGWIVWGDKWTYLKELDRRLTLNAG